MLSLEMLVWYKITSLIHLVSFQNKNIQSTLSENLSVKVQRVFAKRQTKGMMEGERIPTSLIYNGYL